MDKENKKSWDQINATVNKMVAEIRPIIVALAHSFCNILNIALLVTNPADMPLTVAVLACKPTFPLIEVRIGRKLVIRILSFSNSWKQDMSTPTNNSNAIVTVMAGNRSNASS